MRADGATTPEKEHKSERNHNSSGEQGFEEGKRRPELVP
jgi:hypothetical protein